MIRRIFVCMFIVATMNVLCLGGGQAQLVYQLILSFSSGFDSEELGWIDEDSIYKQFDFNTHKFWASCEDGKSARSAVESCRLLPKLSNEWSYTDWGVGLSVAPNWLGGGKASLLIQVDVIDIAPQVIDIHLDEEGRFPST